MKIIIFSLEYNLDTLYILAMQLYSLYVTITLNRLKKTGNEFQDFQKCCQTAGNLFLKMSELTFLNYPYPVFSKNMMKASPLARRV